MRSAVRARGITRFFGDVVALDGVDLDIAAGQVHGLVGPNGAGKTTLLGMLLGLSTPDAGALEILGEPVGRAHAVPDGVAGFVDGPGLYPSLTARQNLTALAVLQRRRADRRDAVEQVLAEVGLADVADDRVRGFSLGMRQRLGVAAALLTKPRLLVLDEPANGLDPTGRHHLHRVLTDLTAEGAAVVLSSHRVDDLAALCAAVTILATGRVVFSGPLAELSAACGELDYRLHASDPALAHELASTTPGLRVLCPKDLRAPLPAGVLAVRGSAADLDRLVGRLVGAGVSLRELAPVVPPLEAAYLALTGGAPSSPRDATAQVPVPANGEAPVGAAR